MACVLNGKRVRADHTLDGNHGRATRQRLLEEESPVAEPGKELLEPDVVFDQIDADGNGNIDFLEWCHGLRILGVSEKDDLSDRDKQAIFVHLDGNNDGLISRTEWREGASWLSRVITLVASNGWNASLKVIKDIWATELARSTGDSKPDLSFERFRDAMLARPDCSKDHVHVSEEDLRLLFSIIDTDKSGVLSYQEWRAFGDFGGAAWTRRLTQGIKGAGEAQLEKFGLARVMFHMTALREVLTGPGCLSEKFRLVLTEFWDSLEDFLEPIECILDLLGVISGFAGVWMAWGEGLDWIELAPLLIFLGIFACHMARSLFPMSLDSVGPIEALIYVEVFKPVSFSVEDYIRIIKRTKAKVDTVPAGTCIWEPSEAGSVLKLIAHGECKVDHIDGTIDKLKEGSFLWDAAFLDEAAVTHDSFAQVSLVEATTELKLMTIDVQRLHEYLSHNEGLRRSFHAVLSKSIAQKMALTQAAHRKQKERNQEMCENIILSARQHINVERSTIFLVNHQEDVLWTYVASGMGDVIKLPLQSNSLAAVTARSNQPLDIPDCYADERFNRQMDTLNNFRTRNMLCYPVRDVKDDKKVVGVIQLINKLTLIPGSPTRRAASVVQDGAAFDDADRRLADQLAWHAGILVHAVMGAID